MGTADRSKKKIQLWKKATIHFALCFVMGFFTGFAPTTTSLFAVSYRNFDNKLLVQESRNKNLGEPESVGNVNRSLMAEIPTSFTDNNTETMAAKDKHDETFNEDDDNDEGDELDVDDKPIQLLSNESQRLLIIITTTRAGDRFLALFLRRLAHTLRLVRPPVLWMVVQARDEAEETAEMLRSTGVMYRHLTFRENFTDSAVEDEHQRNVALSHIEYHRLEGIVHFAAASNVYDLKFFNEIRQIEVIGAWPVVMVSSNRKRVLVDGPICQSSNVVGWFLKDLNNDSINVGRIKNTDVSLKPAKINVSGFGFNSSILWDPDRWGRPSSMPDNSQDSFKFVQEILGDETKVKGIPVNCSKIMLWSLYIPRTMPLSFHKSQNNNKG